MGLFSSDPQAADKKALGEQLQLLEKNPNDVRALMRAAELEHKLGAPREAADHYARAALRYAEEGFTLKAVAVNKVAYSLRPDLPELFEREAGFYAELELIHDAFESLRRAILMHEQKGDRPRALESRKKLLEIDPENAAGRVASAEQSVLEGKVADAIELLSRVAVDLHLQGKTAQRDRVNARMAWLKGHHKVA